MATENLIVTVVDSPEEIFAGALSISQERELEIDTIVERCHEATSTYPDAIAAFSKEMNNANELAYACFHFGAYAEARKSET